MRKILVVLLVLSVLGGAFADWWYFDGSAIMGVVVDFDDDDARIQRDDDGTLNDCCCAGVNNAQFSINYGTESGLSAAVFFNYRSAIEAEISYSGDNYAFYAGRSLMGLLNNTGGFGGLWGWYQFFDGMIHLEAAIAGRDGSWWLSDETVGDLFDSDPYSFSLNKTNLDPMGGGILVNFSFEALDFGIYLKDALPNHDDNLLSYPSWMGTAYEINLAEGDDSVFSTAVVGLKFGMDPVEFAGFFGVENYTAYFGAKIFMDALTLGMSFYGEFEEESKAGFGVSAGFDGGVFFAGVQVGYALDTSDEDAWLIAIAPSFWYNVIPDYMRFVLDAKFEFNTEEVMWEFYPAITWNFKGTGNASRIGIWDSIGTGIGIGYRLAGGRDDETVNELHIAFRWDF